MLLPVVAAAASLLPAVASAAELAAAAESLPCTCSSTVATTALLLSPKPERKENDQLR